MYKRFIKRAVDFFLALLIFTILLPVFIAVILCLAIANRGVVFFIQPRPGKSGKIFKIIKFKTMNDRKDQNGELLPDGKRLTPIGKLVRKTSIDEIPQLLNVIKGDMSLVGPRPLLVQYLALYTPTQRKRHNVRPGITGWAQINGRNAISWSKKLDYDVWYADNLNFTLDIKILFLTILKVFKSEGINSASSATTEAFNGSN